MSNEPSATSRRAFLNDATLGSLMTYSLLHTIFARDLLADDVRPESLAWLHRLNDMSRDLRERELTQLEWQDKLAELYATLDMGSVLKLLDFEKVSARKQFRDKGETAMGRNSSLPKIEGLPTRYVFGHQIFGMKKGRSVLPHGHQRMASAFLMLSGECRGRHFDRVEDHKDHLIVKATIDDVFKAGQFSTISDHRDNVHWFTATSDTSFIFNIHVLNLPSEQFKSGGRVYIDPTGDANAEGLIKAPKISHRDSLKRFG